METTKAFEIKVGAFILAGVVIGFLIIFSIGDINLSKTGYKIAVKFDFASGIGAAAPVRLSGVGVGRVDGVNVVYSDKEKKSYAEVRAWIQSDARIEEDAKITINTLGLLGEKYLEIYPGTPGASLVKDGAVLVGQNPVVMEKLTENLVDLSNSVTTIVKRLENGEGTIGKLLVEDGVYNDLRSIMGNVKDFSSDLKSTGTNFKDFSEDLKKHPWKLLARPRGE
ncbi:MAG: MlaD family protein [Candidatus Omnitrophica bacterium]|nr:MlaD family protein [Candidatus Omnitrophota bacterium]